MKEMFKVYENCHNVNQLVQTLSLSLVLQFAFNDILYLMSLLEHILL